MMRVALLTNFVPPYRVPVFRALREEVGELRILISTVMERDRPWSPDWGDLEVIVQRTWTLQRNFRHERFSQKYELHLPYDTIPQLARWRPDAILTAEFGTRTAQAIAYAKLVRVPVVIWATLADHLERGRGWVRYCARRALVRASERVIVNGESGARYIRSIGGAEDLVARVPYAIELEPFTSIPLGREPAQGRRLLFSGALTERKGADLMVEGAALWGARNPAESLSITVVGDGPLGEELRTAGLPSNVTIEWVGSVEYQQLPAYYASSGILLYPTRGDEWGLVVNEAMAAGLPVIGSVYSQAVDELVEEGRNGWRFTPDGPGSVAEAITRARAAPEAALAAMRAHARATASRITPQRVGATIGALLREATA